MRERERERSLFLSPLSLRLFINKSQLTQSPLHFSLRFVFLEIRFDYTLYILFSFDYKGENYKFGMKNTHFFYYYFCVFTIITVFIVLPNIESPTNRHKNMFFFFFIKRTTRQESCWELRWAFVFALSLFHALIP